MFTVFNEMSKSSADSLSLEELETLVRNLRRELIIEKTQVLELQDRVQQQRTENSDAVSLLGQAELLLEHKIAFILKLDDSLNLRIRELEEECDRKSEEIENRGSRINELEATDERNRAERNEIIEDLAAKLEAANQEIGKAHNTAREIDQQRHEQALARAESEQQQATTAGRLQKTESENEGLRLNLEETRQQITEARNTIGDLENQLSELQQELAQTQNQLDQEESALKSAAQRLDTIESSRWWKLGQLWRVLFGPKL